MDTVSAHNLGNQIYRHNDIGKEKTDALEDILKEINPALTVTKHREVTLESRISGVVFLCIDNIDVRRELCEKWRKNPNIKLVIDGRMRLTDGNIHAAAWDDKKQIDNLINSMNYTHEEALELTPLSACGLTLSVVCTPRIIASLMVSTMIKYINTNVVNILSIVDAYKPFLDNYEN